MHLNFDFLPRKDGGGLAELAELSPDKLGLKPTFIG